MRVTIIGSGYVGLVTGACLAEQGNDVLCLDLDQDKIDALNHGIIPIHEPGLAEIVSRNRAADRLSFTGDVAAGVAHADTIFIAVGTPPDEDGSADLRHVLGAARDIGKHMQGFKVVVDKSTVPVGTGDKVRQVIQQELDARGVEAGFSVVSNPEFLKEGAAVDDFMRPDRIVVGIEDSVHGRRAAAVMKQLYAPFNRNHERTFWMDLRSAELTKYAANAMLATRISFMNELANLAEKVGADVEAVRQGMGSDSRIGYSFLYAGCGYGGSCFPKDVRALYMTAREQDQDMSILRAVEAVNNRQKSVLFSKIAARFGSDLRGRRFAVWGLAFKPNTDDMREAPSLVLLRQLIDAGASAAVHDPVAMAEAKRALARISNRAHAWGALVHFCEKPMETLRGADALILVTEWKAFRSPDLAQARQLLKQPVIFDGRNLFDPISILGAGFEYHGIGRGAPGTVPGRIAAELR
ncbi:MAG TPA: UDP-glucose/GDP-mannose dehydrogenase family protein [Burkholderiaceae bacterium]